MSDFKVFQTLVFHQPKVKKDEKEIEPSIIFPIETVMAKDVSTVERKLIRKLGQEWDDKLDEITIVIRPF